jgi:glutamate synthase domain-containing protein 1
MAFTDGRQIGATLDRNGLRPRASSSPTTTTS